MWLILITNLMQIVSSVWKRVPSDFKDKIRRVFQVYFVRSVVRLYSSRSGAERTAIKDRAKDCEIPISLSIICHVIERRAERFWQQNSFRDLSRDLLFVACATFATSTTQSIIIGWNLPFVFESCLMIWFLDVYLILVMLNRPVWGGLLCVWSAVLLAVFVDKIFWLTWIPSTLIQVALYYRSIKICDKLNSISRVPLMLLYSVAIAFVAASIGQVAMNFTGNRDLVLFRRWFVGDLSAHLIIMVILEICRLLDVPYPSLRWNSDGETDSGTSNSTLSRTDV
jgi:hypothetical protein